MNTAQKTMTLCRREQWAGGVFRGVERREDALCLSGDVFEGFALLPPVDSGEAGFPWGRVKLDAVIGEQCSLRVYARASDESSWPDWERLKRQSALPGGVPGTLQALFGAPAASGPELWLRLKGRRLWLALEMTGSGTERPRVNAVSLGMGGEHMADYLPAIYQGQDFTYRYLSIFTSMFQDVERAVEEFPRQLDPETAEPEMLSYLASWLCMDPEEDTDALKGRFGNIIEEYETMFTPRGIARSVERLTGVEPIIVEAFDVDPNDPKCPDPELFRRLYGDDPYRFFILLPQGTFARRKDMDSFQERMRDLIPAETEFELVLLKPSVQLDWHTYLGVNTRIGNYVPAVLDESATIHYDMTIGGA